MRTSRLSQNTTKILSRMVHAAPPPRRITRSSLARFAHTESSPKKEVVDEIREVVLGEDIEDAITTTSRKRRRITNGSAVSSTLVQSIKLEEEVETHITAPTSSPVKSARKTRKPARKTTDAKTGAVTISPPSDWEEMYNAVLEMRAPGGAASNAAVDTMGCERLAEPTANPKDQRFHTLIALMLSSQTKDTTNAAAMKRLKTELPVCKEGAPKGLNLENILAVKPEVLNELIWAVGFHNNKTKYDHGLYCQSHLHSYCSISQLYIR
jgi:endonuclease III